MSHGETSKVCHHGRGPNDILFEQLKFTLETMSPLCVSHLFVSDCALDKKVAR